jgi:hypothetical protein
MSTCVWIVNRKRTDPWAEPGSYFRNVCGEKATHDSACGPLCAKHAAMATAPDARPQAGR